MSSWTPERLAALDALWAAGVPVNRIAAELGGGLTRNAVIGKAHRRGLAARAMPTQIATARAAKAAKLAGGIAIGDVDSTTCAWPLGATDAKAESFCGRDVAAGHPYCPDHHAKAYQPPRGRPKYPVVETFRKTFKGEFR